MNEFILDTLATLDLPPAMSRRLGLTPGQLTLRRAWPRSAHHLGLEYVAHDGHVVPGQWFDDPGRLEKVARATAQAGAGASTTLSVNGTKVLLQAHGTDRRLIGLAPLLSEPGAELLVHRPERRAVVRLAETEGACYAKVVPPERTRALVETACVARQVGGGAFTTPRVLRVDACRGVILSSPLAGASMYDLLDCEELVPAAWAAGRALRVLHAAAPPATATMHSAADEIGVVLRWLKRLWAFDPELARAVRAETTAVFEALAADRSPPALLHRDFYDKQVFFDTSGQVGLLDFDTLAVGEAALDVANALVHLELRAIQGRCSHRLAMAAATALLEGYRAGPHILRRLSAYADASRLRLACVYAFRPRKTWIVSGLLTRIGQSPVPCRRASPRAG